MDRDDRVRVRFDRGGRFWLVRREDRADSSEEDALCRCSVRIDGREKESARNQLTVLDRRVARGALGRPQLHLDAARVLPILRVRLQRLCAGGTSQPRASDRAEQTRLASNTASNPSIRHAFAICSANGHSIASFALTRRPPSCCGLFLSI